MRRGMLLVLVGLFMAFGAVAETISINDQPTPQMDFSKADYYAAVEAYQSGTATKVQTAILEAAGYFAEAPAIDYAGGPDPYGYMFRDSDEPDGPVYSWVDITGTGTMWVGPPDDGNSGALTLPFTFNFYGVDYTEFYINSNGALIFTDQYVSWNNSQIPTTSLNDLIAPLWADLSPNDGGEIWYGAATVNGQNAMVVSFINVPDYYADYTVTFQCILLEDGSMWFQYNTAVPALGWDAESIGIQGVNDGATGLFISYYDDPVAYPFDGLAIEVYLDGGPEPTSLSGYVYEDGTGTPLEGAELEVDGSFYYTDVTGFYEVTDLVPGDYTIYVTLDGYYTTSETLTLVEGPNTYDWNLVALPPAQTDAYFTDFEADQGWFSTDGAIWMYGMPTVEPAGAYSGDYAWDVVLDGDYPNGSMEWLISTERWMIPVDGGWTINYMHWMDIEGYWDGYAVLVSTDGVFFTFITPEGGYDYDPGALGYPIFSGTSGDWAEVNFDLSGWEGESVFVAFLFVSDGSVQYPGATIDDFRIGPPQPVELMATAVGNTVIPFDGGVLTYDVMLQNNTLNTWNNLLYWTKIMLPGGNMSGPLVTVRFSILPNMYMMAPGQTQDIPDFAPPGEYVFYANVGRFSGPHVTSEFTFTKETAPAGAQPVGDIHTWDGSVPTFVPVSDKTTVAATEIPTEYKMASVYPNPFNPTANVSIALPETAELKLTVFNVMGQQVAELANGKFNAGMQTFTIDGSALASGIYFVKATVPGQLNAIQKVTLMK